MKSDLEGCVESLLLQMRQSEKEAPFPGITTQQNMVNTKDHGKEGEGEEQSLFNRCLDLVRHLQWSTLKEPESMAKMAQLYLPRNVQVKIPWLYAIGEHVKCKCDQVYFNSTTIKIIIKTFLF